MGIIMNDSSADKMAMLEEPVSYLPVNNVTVSVTRLEVMRPIAPNLYFPGLHFRLRLTHFFSDSALIR
jgi:hypothetical protein